jgi:hypothetical protein
MGPFSEKNLLMKKYYDSFFFATESLFSPFFRHS